ncbi:uncharacterized protein [Argopecten irradians]|uniref:uncharacterized protein n=1 Tax=Argopecten irradians TaxID=31199 RepID=UPI00371865FF
MIDGSLLGKNSHHNMLRRISTQNYDPKQEALREVMLIARILTVAKMVSVLLCCRMENHWSMHPEHLLPRKGSGHKFEKEALATLYGAERFDQYTYGRKIVIENDHKPLESILKKPLSSAPRRLQDIIMKLYRYDVEFRFLKGTSLVIADTLSRAYLDEARPRIMNIEVNEDISDKWLREICDGHIIRP